MNNDVINIVTPVLKAPRGDVAPTLGTAEIGSFINYKVLIYL